MQGTKVSSRQVNPQPTALNEDVAILTDCRLSTRFRILLTDNRILANPINPVDGQQYLWEVIQDDNGNRLLELDTKFSFGTDITSLVLSTAPNLRDFITAIYNGTKDKFYVVGISRGY